MLNNILNLEGVSVLNKKQQKIVNGGKAGTCAAQVTKADGTQMIIVDVSMEDAQIAAGLGASQGLSNNWCCDSCGSASWLQGIK